MSHNKRGVVFSQLANWEQIEIRDQFNVDGKIHKIFSDPLFEKYTWLKTEKHGWSILNANSLPLESNKMRV